MPTGAYHLCAGAGAEAAGEATGGSQRGPAAGEWCVVLRPLPSIAFVPVSSSYDLTGAPLPVHVVGPLRNTTVWLRTRTGGWVSSQASWSKHGKMRCVVLLGAGPPPPILSPPAQARVRPAFAGLVSNALPAL